LLEKYKKSVSVIYNRTDQFTTQIFAYPSPQSYQLQEILASTRKKKKRKTEEKKREQSSFHTICRLPWLLTTTLHVLQSRGSFHQTRDEMGVVIASIFDLFHKKNSHNCLLPFLPSRGQSRSLFANIKKRISVYIYKPNLATKDPTDFFQSQQYNKSE
jgi:hypothetical protein